VPEGPLLSARRALWRLARAVHSRLPARPGARVPLARLAPVAGAAGRLASVLRLHGPLPRELREVLPEETAASLRRVARAVVALEFRNRLVQETVQRCGLESLAGLVAPHESWTALAPPAVLLSFHVGALPALPGGLPRLGAPSFVIREGPLYAPPAGHVLGFTRGDVRVRAALLAEAVRRLRAGGFVTLAADRPWGTRTDPVPCLGRLLRFGRGAFALSRMTGAPVVPVIAVWARGGAVALHAYAPLERAPGRPVEAALAEAAGRFLDGFVRRSPDQLSLGTLFELLDAPRA
jgi:hypothetical protein